MADPRPRLFDAVLTALRAAAAPLLLVADDLQHGDSESCQAPALPAAGRHPELPLLVVATAREEDLASAPAVQDLLPPCAATNGSTSSSWGR